jgi:hypothetical protein
VDYLHKEILNLARSEQGFVFLCESLDILRFVSGEEVGKKKCFFSKKKIATFSKVKSLKKQLNKQWYRYQKQE